MAASQSTQSTQRTTYLRVRLATLASGRWSAEWGAHFAGQTLSSPIVAADARDSADFHLPTDAYAAPLTPDEMGLIGALRAIEKREPRAYTTNQMERVANEVLTMQMRQMTDRERLLVRLRGGPVFSASAAMSLRGRTVS